MTMTTHPAPAPRRPARRVLRAVAAAALAAVVATTLALVSVAPVAAQPGATTSTLPTDNRELGNSLPKPNRGMTPQDAGDPGGWLQMSLFFLLCAAIVAIAGLVWWSSRRARARREAAGLDPVSVARRKGVGVRAEPDPQVDSGRSA